MSKEQYERLGIIFDSLIYQAGTFSKTGKIFDKEKWEEALKAENTTNDEWVAYLCDSLDRKFNFKLGDQHG